VPFAEWGSANPTLPFPLLTAIKAQTLCEEIAHLE
jgi:hypothetical protein